MPKTPEDIPSTPLPLPKGFRWCDVDVSLDSEIQDVFDLLHKNYVEDDEEAFRFRYSPDFLKWALTPPGHVKEWHVGIRTDNDARRLVGFITAVPATLLVRNSRGDGGEGGPSSSSSAPVLASEVNFLCVHKKLRSRRLAPVLIREVTRRVNRRGVWHAAYTAGVLLPRPVATARYWHRSLDARKLVDVGFCRVPPRVTMARYVKLHRLPEAPATPGLRPMRRGDAPAVAALLAERMKRFALAPEMSAAEVEHYLTPREGVVYSYVVEKEGGEVGGGGESGTAAAADEEEKEEEEEVEEGQGEEEDNGEEVESSSNGENATTAAASAPASAPSASTSPAVAAAGAAAAAAASQSKKKKNKRTKKKGSTAPTMTPAITDLVSFYTLPSTVVGGRGGHDTLTAAFSFYSVAGSVSPRQLAGDALVLARGTGHDVFNALDIADNDQDEVLRALKFAPGDGRLRYYLYNWRMGGREELAAKEIGLVLL